jgi:2-(1,2-epoxy-1,2-dihydrophenyl)acetyl-CoA isomerase
VIWKKKPYNLAHQIAKGSPLTMGLNKKLLNMSWDLSLEDVLEIEAQSQAAYFQSHDHMEGVKVFFEKRLPRFKGK